MNDWKDIWKNRTSKKIKLSHLELLELNGYDNSRSVITPAELCKTQQLYFSILDPKYKFADYSYFEVGCGCGAFLYDLWMHGHKVAGIDISENLIDIAKKHLIGSDFSVAEAINLNTTEKFDHVVSFGVIFYFPNIEYLETVIFKMLEKANISVSIYDIQDLDHKEENELMRKTTYGPNYEKDYAGLSHLYMPKSWFIEFAKKNNLHLTIFDQSINGYENGKYRYNVTFKHR